MKTLVKHIMTIAFLGGAAVAHAKNYTYDLVNLDSFNGQINYPGLDLTHAKSAIFTVTRSAQSPDAEIKSMEINFPNAGKLRADNFKRVDSNHYRALVSGAWVFKEVMVELDTPNLTPSLPVNITVSVTEQTSYLNPINGSPGSILLHAHGILHDVTPSIVVDTANVTLNGKNISLSLKDRLSTSAPGNYQGVGFAIDSIWAGRGQKTLYFPAPVTPERADRIDPIAILIEGPSNDPAVRIKFQDGTAEISTPPIPLKPLLDQAYGP